MEARVRTTAAPLFHVRLQARPESAPLLRERLSIWLEELRAAAGDVFDLSLAATEAFANAIEHPHEPTSRLIEVDGSFTDGVLALTLRDFGCWGDQRQREEGGYGFPLMRRLVDALEVDTGSEGTVVTLRRRLPSRGT